MSAELIFIPSIVWIRTLAATTLPQLTLFLMTLKHHWTDIFIKILFKSKYTLIDFIPIEVISQKSKFRSCHFYRHCDDRDA